MDDVFDVVGPVLAEVFVVWADHQGVQLSGPCGPAPWYLEVEAGADPMLVVQRVATAVLGGVRLLHSTSWRRDRTGVVLTFLAVVDASVCAELASVGVHRAELARGSSSAAPAEIATAQVLEHALRHLAWLDRDDPVVMGALSNTWKAALAGYKPEPFRHLG